MEKKQYIVYLNKSFDCWVMDAHLWAKENNMNPDEYTILSEVAFYVYLEKDIIKDCPVYFCNKVLRDDNLKNL